MNSSCDLFIFFEFITYISKITPTFDLGILKLKFNKQGLLFEF